MLAKISLKYWANHKMRLFTLMLTLVFGVSALCCTALLIRSEKHAVLENALIYGKNAGLYPVKCTWSPIKGPSGNIEFLMLYSKSEAENLCDCSQTVENAWKFFEDKK